MTISHTQTMKALPFGFALLTLTCLAQDEPPPPDPTQASPRMKAALMAGGTAIPELTVRGLIFGGARDGAALILEIGAGGPRVLARPNVPFVAIANGEARKLVIKQVSGDGILIEAPAEKESVTLPSFGPAELGRTSPPGGVDYVEFRDLPLLDALRMLADQTGNNYSASVEANKIAVNTMLRNVSANHVVEEICKSHNLWFKRDELSGIMRIMTVAEFEKDLVGFREEQTEVFTLKFPNVTEVANAVADLYGDRVQLSLNGEANDEDSLVDLEGRFDRFETLTQRAQSANSQNGSNNLIGGNVNGFYNNGGETSGFGGSTSRGRGNRLDGGSARNRNDRRPAGDTPDSLRQAEEDLFRNLTPGPGPARRARALHRTARRAGDGRRGGAAPPAHPHLRERQPPE